MQKIQLKTEDNNLILSIGAGIFIWLTITSFLSVFVHTVLKSLWIIFGVSSVSIYCVNELLYSTLLLLIIWKLLNWMSRKSLDISAAKKVLMIAIIGFAACQIYQNIVSFFVLPYVFDHYLTPLLAYDTETRRVNLRFFSIGLEFLRYVLLALFIYKKVIVVHNDQTQN